MSDDATKDEAQAVVEMADKSVSDVEVAVEADKVEVSAEALVASDAADDDDAEALVASEASDADDAEALVASEAEIDEGDVDDEADVSDDTLTFSNGVIEKIVALAMREVPGVVGMKGTWFNRVQDAFGASDAKKGVTVEVAPDSSVRVNISVIIAYGVYAPKVFEDARRAVVKAVKGMTGLEVSGINLRIEDVLTPEEYNRGKKGVSKDKDKDKEPAADADSDADADAGLRPTR